MDQFYQLCSMEQKRRVFCFQPLLSEVAERSHFRNRFIENEVHEMYGGSDTHGRSVLGDQRLRARI